MRKSKNAQIWISAVLDILIISSSLVLILKIGVPILDGMKDKSSFSNAKQTMLTLDKTIQEVASEGQGSQRIIPVDVKDGEIRIGSNEIVYEMKTKTEIIDERTSINLGNLVVSSNANVKTWEQNNLYIMQTSIEGDIFNVSIKKIGSRSNYASINTTDLIQSVYYDGEKLDGNFSFSINGDSQSTTGTGYTEMIPDGNNTNLGRAKVIAHINSTVFEYDLEFTLESFADFLTVKLKNVK